MRRFLFENGLSIFFFVILVATLIGQSFAGHSVYNAEQAEHDAATVSYWGYVFSSHFGQAVMENWQSEFLQFSLFIAATVWLVQKGSAESKPLEKAGHESKQAQKMKGYADRGAAAWAKARNLKLWLYSNSLLLVMTSLFFATWIVQSLTGWNESNAEQREHGGHPLRWVDYVTSAEFWEDSLQNWQSEFLAVGTMVVFSIYLRQRGSPESKRVGTAHEHTGSDD